MSQLRLQRLTDYASISLAGICAVHCLLAPVALILFPVMGSAFLFSEFFHELMVLVVIPSSFVAMFLGCRRHKDVYVAFLGVCGLCLLVAGAFGAEGYLETALTLAGAFVMVFGHARNFWLCSRDGCRCSRDGCRY